MDYKENDRAGWHSRIPLPNNPRVSFIIAAYKRPVQIKVTIASILAQTHQNFEIIVVHDGPGGKQVELAVSNFNDDRISFHELDRNYNDFGNTSKEYGSQLATGDYIGHSNDDNYYAPVYFEWMLSDMMNQGCDLGYCNMIHSASCWYGFDTYPAATRIDGGGWLCKADIVKKTEWGDKKDMCADGHYVEALMKSCNKAIKIGGFLFVHN